MFWSGEIFFLLVICSYQEIVAGNIHFGVSKLYVSCQYKLVTCSAVLPFPPRNASGRTLTALVMLSEEALRVLPLITFLLLEPSHWEKRGAQVGSGESFGFCFLYQNKSVCVGLCKVKMACQVDSIRCG